MLIRKTSFQLNYCLLINACLFSALVFACSHTTSVDSEEASKVDKLSNILESLSDEVLTHEATEVSSTLITTTFSLNDEYEMMSPPRYHNLLVQIGLRERGLCCHWVEDLQTELNKLNTYSLKFAWLVAYQGKPFHEHSSLVIYAGDKSWQEGVVFDPWRQSGMPFWLSAKEDKYPWKMHPLNSRRDVLHCK